MIRMIVNLYTCSTIIRPNQKKGIFLDMLEADTNGKTVQKPWYRIIADCSAQRAWLYAAVDGLYRVKPGNSVTIYTDSEYVLSGSEWVEKWERAGWINAKGQQVRNQDLWKWYFDLIRERETLILLCKDHQYHSWMGWEAQKIVKEQLKT